MLPSDITPHLALVWLLAAFILGAGWTLGAWMVARLLRAFG